MKHENILIDDGTSIYELDSECMNNKKQRNVEQRNTESQNQGESDRQSKQRKDQ